MSQLVSTKLVPNITQPHMPTSSIFAKVLQEPSRIVEFNGKTGKTIVFKNLKIGDGGLSEIWEVFGIMGVGPLALKELKAYGPNDTRKKRLAERSINGDLLAFSICDPNIARIFEIDLSQKLTLMERLNGNSLSGVLETQVLSIAEIIRIALGIANGLKTLHSKGFVHQDIKPANVFLTSNDGVKIVDFGLMEQESTSRIPKDVVLGTPLYASSEAVNGKGTTSASDMYSFGLTLYEMIVGKKEFRDLFDFAEIDDTLRYKLYGRPIAPDYSRDDVPQWLSKMVMGCITQNVPNRLTATDVLSILAPLN